MERQKSVAIIGGGVAGIAAAVALAEAGLEVTLCEKRPLLGGRASSSQNAQTDERVDDCQHGTMRCCTALADLLERLGVHHQIEYFDSLLYLDCEGHYSEMKGGVLPAPLHTSFSFLRLKFLGLKDKIGIAKALISVLREGVRADHEATSVAVWLKGKNQTALALQRFWRPILVSACNDELENISCTHAFKVFRDGFLSNAIGFHFGVPRTPLGTLYTEPTLAFLHTRGGRALTRTIVDQIVFENGHVSEIVLQSGERLIADAYVSALQSDLLLKLLPLEAREGVPYFENLYAFEFAPLAGIHLWFDRAIACPPALALLDRDVEWVFNKTENFRLDSQEGTYLSALISASRRFASLPKAELLKLALKDIREALPTAQEAQLVRSQVVRWPKATFVPAPGVEALRPDQRSPIPNFYVAGEWTRTGWPSTMESAARSGYLAAERVLEDFGTPRRLLPPDLPASFLARLLMPRR